VEFEAPETAAGLKNFRDRRSSVSLRLHRYQLRESFPPVGQNYPHQSRARSVIFPDWNRLEWGLFSYSARSSRMGQSLARSPVSRLVPGLVRDRPGFACARSRQGAKVVAAPADVAARRSRPPEAKNPTCRFGRRRLTAPDDRSQEGRRPQDKFGCSTSSSTTNALIVARRATTAHFADPIDFDNLRESSRWNFFGLTENDCVFPADAAGLQQAGDRQHPLRRCLFAKTAFPASQAITRLANRGPGIQRGDPGPELSTDVR